MALNQRRLRLVVSTILSIVFLGASVYLADCYFRLWTQTYIVEYAQQKHAAMNSPEGLAALEQDRQCGELIDKFARIYPLWKSALTGERPDPIHCDTNGVRPSDDEISHAFVPVLARWALAFVPGSIVLAYFLSYLFLRGIPNLAGLAKDEATHMGMQAKSWLTAPDQK